MSHILGLSAYYHDSAAALVSDGKIIAAAQEERFTRKKHDAGFPTEAIRYCLAEAGLAFNAIDQVVFYDKPLVKFERLLETYIATTPRGFPSFLAAMPIWLKEKLYLKTVIRRELAAIGECEKKALPSLLFAEHHQSHAASAFFPSPFPEAAVLCMDGVGEWATTTVWHGKDNRVHPLWQIDFPHSLGLLYSAFTYFTGFKVNYGEYKLMGLAPYGVPRYTELILDNLIDVKPDGTFRLAMEYFDYATGLRMTNDRLSALFRRGPRAPESPLTQDEMDIAASIQVVTEDIVLRLAQTIHAETGLKNLCLAGGVALNCVANGRLLREGPFEELWIQPAAGDAGGALGCALATWHEYLDQPRSCDTQDAMQGAYLGPAFTDAEARESLESVGAVYNTLEASELYSSVAELLAKGNVVGWFQGRMEFGPRALGARSIIGDPRNIEMQSVMNLKIKYRESFRPFAPAVLAERIADYFEQAEDSPYMLLVANVREMLRKQVSVEDDQLFGIDKLNVLRSELPAITHIDYSARIQSVHKETNPQFHALLSAFDQLTGCGVVVNTSFNVRGEPIVNTPEDAFNCFMGTELDVLAIGNCYLEKKDQVVSSKTDYRNKYQLD